MSHRPAPTTVANVLLQGDDVLAVRARTTLAAADVVTLVGPAPVRVGVRDHDGEPELVGVPAAMHAVVGRGRRTTVVIAPRLDDGVWLVLDGRLVERDRIVVLAVEAVRVGCPHGHGHARPLDLDAYAQAVPDTLRAAMPRLVEHTNAAHGPELRELTRRTLGVATGEVAAATLADLDAAGVTLRIVDVDGATDVRLPFPHVALTAPELVDRLRTALTSV